MPYVAQSHAGPWPAGTLIADAALDAHPFKDKFLRTRSVIPASDASLAAAGDPVQTQVRLAEIAAQIGQLEAERAALQGLTLDPTAPAQVTYHLDPSQPPSAADAAAHRAAGAEVIQPTATGVVVGTIAPGEAAADPPAAPTGKK